MLHIGCTWAVYTLLAHNLTVGVDSPGHNLESGRQVKIRTSSGLLKKLVGVMWLSAQAGHDTDRHSWTHRPLDRAVALPPGRFPHLETEGDRGTELIKPERERGLPPLTRLPAR